MTGTTFLNSPRISGNLVGVLGDVAGVARAGISPIYKTPADDGISSSGGSLIVPPADHFAQVGGPISRELAMTKLRDVMLALKTRQPRKEFDPNRIQKTDIRIGYLDGEPVERMVLFLRANGCLYKEQTGGCTECGFWGETAQMQRKVAGQEFVNQVANALETIDLQRYPILCLYNAGSFFQEEEIEFRAVEEICRLISQKLPGLKRLVVECRVDYVRREHLEAVQKILGKNIQLTLCSSIETQDDTIRNLCLHKGMSKAQFENVIEMINSLGMHSIINVLIKPPFLTEREAIDDVVATTKYVHDIGAKEIHYESMTVEEGTLVSLLYKHGDYRLPWLWSIVEILQRVSSYARPYLTHFVYELDHLATPHSCPRCQPALEEAIYRTYCMKFDASALGHLNCECRNDWKREIGLADPKSLEERVYRALMSLERDGMLIV